MQTQCFLKTTFSCFHKYLVKSFMCSRLHRLLNPSSIGFLRVVQTWFLWAGMHVITHHGNHAHSRKKTINAIIEKIFPAHKNISSHLRKLLWIIKIQMVFIWQMQWNIPCLEPLNFYLLHNRKNHYCHYCSRFYFLLSFVSHSDMRTNQMFGKTLVFLAWLLYHTVSTVTGSRQQFCRSGKPSYYAVSS